MPKRGQSKHLHDRSPSGLSPIRWLGFQRNPTSHAELGPRNLTSHAELGPLSRTQHIVTAYHHTRGWLKLGKLSIVPVSADLRLADEWYDEATAATAALLCVGEILRQDLSI